MLASLLTFVICLCLLLMDAVAFFLTVRLLATLIPAKPLIYLDRIGDAGVEAVTYAVMARTGRWFKRPLTRNQEYAVALCLIVLARTLLSAVLRAFK